MQHAAPLPAVRRQRLRCSSTVTGRPQRAQVSCTCRCPGCVALRRYGVQLATTWPRIWHCSQPSILFIADLSLLAWLSWATSTAGAQRPSITSQTDNHSRQCITLQLLVGPAAGKGCRTRLSWRPPRPRSDIAPATQQQADRSNPQQGQQRHIRACGRANRTTSAAGTAIGARRRHIAGGGRIAGRHDHDFLCRSAQLHSG